jgi:DNA polymerase
VYLANVLKCRPPQNRDPLEAEIASCEPHLFRQIELIRPRVVATLGNFATRLLSGRPFGITKVHGQEHEVALAAATVVLYPLYHPAAALYTPSMLRALEEDFARIPALLGRPAPEPRPAAVLEPDALPVPAAQEEHVRGNAVQLGLF